MPVNYIVQYTVRVDRFLDSFLVEENFFVSTVTQTSHNVLYFLNFSNSLQLSSFLNVLILNPCLIFFWYENVTQTSIEEIEDK